MAPAHPKTRAAPTSSCPTARPRYPEDTPQTPGALGGFTSGGHEEGRRPFSRASPACQGASPTAPVRGEGSRSATWGLGPAWPGSQPRACWQQVPLLDGGRLLPVLLTCRGFSCPLLFPQPYVPRDPPVLRVTEGPFFSEVVACYEHVHQVIRLYNLPGEHCRWGARGGGCRLRGLWCSLAPACCLCLFTRLSPESMLFEQACCVAFVE